MEFRVAECNVPMMGISYISGFATHTHTHTTAPAPAPPPPAEAAAAAAKGTSRTKCTTFK